MDAGNDAAVSRAAARRPAPALPTHTRMPPLVYRYIKFYLNYATGNTYGLHIVPNFAIKLQRSSKLTARAVAGQSVANSGHTSAPVSPNTLCSYSETEKHKFSIFSYGTYKQNTRT